MSTSASSARPTVSCLLVTADRPQLIKRALRCYQQQTYDALELVVLDNGDEPVEEVVRSFDLPGELRYLRVEPEPDLWIGGLRNRALDEATGTFVVPQWDDDDWSHPERVERQVEVLQQGYDACTILGTLMHVDHPDYFDHPFIGILPDGVPPTIMHRRDAEIRYPNIRRTSDTDFLNDWREKRYTIMPREDSYLYLRYSHDDNLWETDHFLRRMRNTPKDLLLYAWHHYVQGDVFGHPRFQLTDKMKEAFELYLDDSFRYDLFETRSREEQPEMGTSSVA
jgi:glycosyltransferase involved in cell wall biosynthesis